MAFKMCHRKVLYFLFAFYTPFLLTSSSSHLCKCNTHKTSLLISSYILMQNVLAISNKKRSGEKMQTEVTFLRHPSFGTTRNSWKGSAGTTSRYIRHSRSTHLKIIGLARKRKLSNWILVPACIQKSGPWSPLSKGKHDLQYKSHLYRLSRPLCNL